MSTDETQLEARTERLREELAEAWRMMEEEQNAHLNGFASFVGPCAHGRDPWTRCETCSQGNAVQAVVARMQRAEADNATLLEAGQAVMAVLSEDMAQGGTGLSRIEAKVLAAFDRLAETFGAAAQLHPGAALLEERDNLRRMHVANVAAGERVSAEFNRAGVGNARDGVLMRALALLEERRLLLAVVEEAHAFLHSGEGQDEGPLQDALDALPLSAEEEAMIARGWQRLSRVPSITAGDAYERGAVVRPGDVREALREGKRLVDAYGRGAVVPPEPDSAALFAAVRRTVAAASGKERTWDALVTLERERGEMAGRLERLEQVIAAFRELEWTGGGDWRGDCPFRRVAGLVCLGTTNKDETPKPHADGCPFALLHTLLPESGASPEVVPVARVREVVRAVMAEAQASVREHRGKGEPGSTRHDLAMVAAGGYAAGEEVLRRLALPVEATASVPVARVKAVLAAHAGVQHAYPDTAIKAAARDLGLPLEG